jgi:uncharacterized protein
MDARTLTVPVFPLPNVVFMPHSLLPLHIFEPRYKQMFSDALAGDGHIGVVQLKPGWEKDYYGDPAVYRVLGVGTIRTSERWPDGRYDVVLEGTARGRIVSEARRGDYRVAEVELLPDLLGEDLRAEIDALHSQFLPSFRRIAAHDDIAQSGLRPRSWDDPGPGIVADVLAAKFIQNAYDLQSILSETDVLRRLQLVRVHLRAVLNGLA